ncbi:MAG: DUF348 domain-containing protein [Anaerolineae bacterium]|nr:DUF348 domain-containing protein [Anaerolineae bacterium]
MLAGIVVAMACMAVCAAVLALNLMQPSPSKPATVVVAGIGYQVQTHSETVGDLLREFSIPLNAGDTVSPAPESTIAAGLVVRVDRARQVTVTVDGNVQPVQTVFTNPTDILRAAGVSVGAKDRVLVDGTLTQMNDLLVWPVPVSNITIQRAIPVQIVDGTQTITVQTTAPTVAEALYEAGTTLYLADEVQPALNTPVTTSLVINIHRSQPISIVADGVTLETRTQGTTVANALVGAGVILGGLDYAIPPETSELQPGMSIRVIRVSEKVDVQQAVLPFETVYQADANMELDQKVVSQEGQKGIRETNIRIRYENGVEVNRTEEDSAVARAPINRVIAYGTNIVLRTVDTPDGPKEYWRVLRMYTTSYHPATLGGDDVTATGRKLTKGVVGIDPKIIPYGTQLFVPNYGVGIAADTGGPRKFKLWIDLGYDDSNWVSWSKYSDVYLLTPIPANIVYLLPD